VVKYVKVKYMELLNQRYIANACICALGATQEGALFGGKKAWEDLQSGKITKDEWQAKRNNQLYASGDSGKKRHGNTCIRIDPKNSRILVNDPSRYGKWIEGKLYLPTKFKPDLTCYSVRLIHRNGKFEVKITWEEKTPEITTDPRNGCIGIDTNPGGLGLALVSPDGNLLAHQFKVLERIQFARSEKRDYDIGVMAKEVVAEAKLKGMPIALERLEFSQKKKPAGTEYRKFRRMKSNFCYRKILNAIRSKAAKEGVEVVEVDPAFTSVLGKLKYAAPLSLSPHVAAALVIGRRAYGMLEKETFSVVKTETVKVRVKPKKLKKGSPKSKKAVTLKSKSIVRLTLAGRDRTQELTQKAYSWLRKGPFLKLKNSFPHRDAAGSETQDQPLPLGDLGSGKGSRLGASLHSEPFPITGRERQGLFEKTSSVGDEMALREVLKTSRIQDAREAQY